MDADDIYTWVAKHAFLAVADVNGVSVSVIPIADDGLIPLAAVQLDGHGAGERRPAAGKRQGRAAAAVLRLHVPDDGDGPGGDGRDQRNGVVLPPVVHADDSAGKKSYLVDIVNAKLIKRTTFASIIAHVDCDRRAGPGFRLGMQGPT